MYNPWELDRVIWRMLKGGQTQQQICYLLDVSVERVNDARQAWHFVKRHNVNFGATIPKEIVAKAIAEMSPVDAARTLCLTEKELMNVSF